MFSDIHPEQRLLEFHQRHTRLLRAAEHVRAFRAMNEKHRSRSGRRLRRKAARPDRTGVGPNDRGTP